MDKKEKLLSQIKEKMQKDDSLPLRKTASNLVFGDGDPNAEVMFIGEGPGFWEDKKGIPFVGNAGALLNQLLHQIGIPREDVFITNVVHFRPPENRDPEPSELKAYEPYLDQMIDVIKPKLIVTLGRFSMGKFIPNAKITGIHGKPSEVSWKGSMLTVVPMYHPAAGLRNPQIKMSLFEDFKKLPEILKQLEEKGSEEKIEEKSEQMSLI